MKKAFLILLLFFSSLLFLFPIEVDAGWVDGYWKKDGTYVAGYWRSDPNGLKYDNYSFDGDWSDAYNDSYFSSDRNYSSDWYQPAWTTQDDYWVGKSFYDARHNYDDYDYNDYDYSYDFWDDPIYKYTPSYDYGYEPLELYEPPTYEYEPYVYEPYEPPTYEYEPYVYEPYEPPTYEYDWNY